MIPRSLRRVYNRSPLRFITLTIFVLFMFDALDISNSQPYPIRTNTLSPSLKSQKIFIASIHRNSEYMLRLYWNTALLDLVGFLGPENCYVSIVESGSLEDTKGALRELGEELDRLGVQNRIVLGEGVDEQTKGLKHVPPEGEREGWVWSGSKRGDDGWEKRRIPALAKLRNDAMKPLWEGEGEAGKRWDKVLWINDVVFTNDDIATLLSTRDGDYAAVCSLDFSSNAEVYYDTFALRDSSGLKTGTASYPYFISTPSLSALQSLDAIPVKSCWNGIVAFDSTPFYSLPPPSLDSQSPITPTKLQFRGVPDSLAQQHVEGSECCLIHSDNPLRAQKGIWVNPNVRVAFNASTYPLVNPQGPIPIAVLEREDAMKQMYARSQGREGGAIRRGQWPGKQELFFGTWWNRILRWGMLGRVKGWGESKVVERRVEGWIARGDMDGEKREEVGRECLVNEMQVLYLNGWLHV